MVKVKGIMAYDSPDDYDFDLYQMRIYIDEANYYGRGMGTNYGQDDNFYLSRVRGEEAPPDTKHLK